MPAQMIDDIKAYLSKHGSGTADELSRALGVTRADIHHHLKKMSQDHLLVHTSSTDTPRRGRRPYRFSLSPNAYPDNLLALSRVMLSLFTEVKDMDVIWKELATRMTGKGHKQKQPAAILGSAINWLNSHHYQAKWEARQSGPCIILQNCPYRSLLLDFPNICQLDHCIINKLTGYAISTFTQKKLADGHIRSCFFELNN